MQPLGNNILIEVEDFEEKTKSGLIITESWKDLSPFGIIKSVGPDVIEKRLQPGTRVVYARYGAVQIFEGSKLLTEDSAEKKLRLIKEQHVLAIAEAKNG